MKGRKPKPTSLKIAEGDTRKVGRHKLCGKLEQEPQAAPGLGPCPSRLTGVAAKAWAFWSEELTEMGIACRPDAQMLEGACVNYATAVKADGKVAELGEVFEEPILSDGGEVVGTRQRKNLWLLVRDKSWMLVHRFCSEFGLSPASRTRLTIERKDNSEQDLAALLAMPRKPKELPIQ